MTNEEASRYLLEQARTRGVALEAIGQQDRNVSLRVHAGRPEQLTHAARSGLGVRVVTDGRVGYAYTEELSPQALDWMLAEAIENASLQEEQSGFLLPGTALGRRDLLGNALAGSLESKLQAALGFEGTIREDARVKQVALAAYGERIWEQTVASTEGVQGTYRRGAAGLMASVIMQEGESLKQGFGRQWVNDLQALDPGRTALDVTERTGRLLGARPLQTGRYPAYFEPRAFAQLLLAFWPMWSGKAIMEGKSLLANRIGQRIGAEAVTLLDDATLPQGLASRPFDAEGTPARPLTLVENGILRAFFTNSETARALGVENTAHAARGYRGFLDVAPSNLYLRAGPGAHPERGVIVTDLMGIHAGANAITGQFSVQALGLLVEGGAVTHPVENFAVAGDFLTLLARVSGLGETLDWEFFGSVAAGAPLVAITELSFAGG